MKKIILFLLIILKSIQITNAQVPTWQWAKEGDCSISGFGEGWNVATDASENVYLYGYFRDTLSFGNYVLTDTNSNGNLIDIFLAKYNSTGSVIWAKSSKGAGNINFGNIATDHEGNVYLTGGYWQGYVSFDSFILDYTSQQCMYLVKYDSSGNVLWVKNTDTSLNVLASSLVIDNNGCSYLTGIYYSPSITFGSFTLTNPYSQNGFIVKYDSSGNVIWAKNQADSGSIICNSITTDPSFNSYITGINSDTSAVFGNNNIGPGFFITKFDSSGQAIWSKNTNRPYGISFSIATNSSNNVYASGGFADSTISFGSYILTNPNYSQFNNSNCFFIVKYDSSGNIIWAKSFYSPLNPELQLFGLVVDINDNPFMTGSMGFPSYYPFIFDTTTLQVPSGSIDAMFAVKYDSSGQFSWALALTSGGDDNNGIAVSSSNNIYIGGDFWEYPLILGNDTLPNINGSEIPFVAKLGFGSLETITNKKEVKNNISIYPNPNDGNFTLSYHLSQSVTSNYDLEITDVLGSTVHHQPLNKPNTTIDVSQLSNGVYFYRVSNDKETTSGKFVILR